MLLKTETWSKANRTGQIIGSRTEFPLVLFYSCTCHNTQGLTLPKAVVHCSREFVPGLIYVAVSHMRRLYKEEVSGNLLHTCLRSLYKERGGGGGGGGGGGFNWKSVNTF